MVRLLAVSGSPSPNSRTAWLTELICERLRAPETRVDHIRVIDLDLAPLARGDGTNASVAAFAEAIAEAHGLIVATPIYKAAYSGLIKMGLDGLPQYALAGKVVLPVATGGSPAHVLALDYALRPVLQSMGARHVAQSLFVSEQDVVAGPPPTLTANADAMLAATLANYRHSLTDNDDARWLGHPRPPMLALLGGDGMAPAPATSEGRP